MKIYVEGEDITQMCKDDSITCKESNATSLKETNVVNEDKEIIVVVCECDNHTCNKCKKEKSENCDCQYCQEDQTVFTPKRCMKSGFQRNNVLDYDADDNILFARSIMDRLDKFQIIFNNPTATYYAGDTVYGYGWVVIKELMYVQSVCLEAIGEAKVEWMTSSDIQASDEEVFNYTTVLPIKGEKKIEDEGLLQPGSHYFPFEFTLPSKLPSSFKGKHGRLRYFVRMTIYSPGGPHHERTSKFAVIGSLDLNAEPDAALPVENDTFETVGSWCCISGTVTASVKLDRKGYTIKEAIPVWAQIKNLSTRRLASTQVSLIQNVTYYSYRGRFSECTVLVTIHKGSVAPRSKQTWNRELLSIPTVPSSHLRGCKIIDVQYSIELCIKPSGLGRKVKLPVDIVIGTTPLIDHQPRVTCHPLVSPEDSLNPFPFFSDTNSDQVFLTDFSFQQMLPSAPPWEEDDDIP